MGKTAFVAGLVALFLFTVLFRFLTLKDGFPNDHFLHLAGAQQILFGEWPTRDFLDYGLPLLYGASSTAQLLFGRSLFAEAMLVVSGFALAAVLTAAAVRQLTESRVLALLAAALEIAIVPRTYGYPKILTYAAVFFLIQRYVTRPSTGRLVALAAGVVIAFLFRHDYGLYLGVGAAVAAWLAPDSASGNGVGGVTRAATLVGVVALLTSPYLLYVQFYDGLWAYFQKGLEFRAGELGRQGYVWPRLFGTDPHHAALLYEYWALPIAAALMLVVYRGQQSARTITARVAPIVVVALLANATFLRNPLNTRLPDAIVPAVILGSWLMVCAWRARHRWVWRPASTALVVLFAVSVMEVGATMENLDRAGLLVTWRRLPEFVGEVEASLRAPHAERQLPSRAAHALLPFYSYVDRCTSRDHRLLVFGFVPEVMFFTQRAFAGGQPVLMSGYYASDAYQQDILRHLRKEVVPFVVVAGQAYTRSTFSSFPLVAAYVQVRYVPLVALGPDPATGVQILFDSTLPVPGRDPETGWPCLK